MDIDSQGKYWINSRRGSGFLTQDDTGNYHWNHTPFKVLEGEIPKFFIFADHTVWFGSFDSLFRFDASVHKDYQVTYPALIRRVKVKNRSSLRGASISDIKFKNNSVLFEFSASFYEHLDQNLFRYQLEGFDSSWSDWGSETRKEYTNLDEGRYRFRVQARNIFNQESTVAQQAFRVLPPWYRTLPAYGGIVFMFFLLLYGGIRLNSQRLLAAKKRLEEIVAERTAEVVAQKEELESYASDLYTTNRKLVEAKDALWGEMELAKKIQTVLLPDEPKIQGYSIIGYMKPADEVGGDYYDVINVGGRDWVVIGDVSGHGVPSGLVMMMVQSTLHLALDTLKDASPDVILEYVNRVIHKNIEKLGEEKYMTITVFSCIENGKMYFSGLHQDIMIYRSEKKEVELVETEGMWIGLMDEIGDLLQVDDLTLNPGDVMLLFTDGIPEAVDKQEEMFSDEKLMALLKDLGHLTPEEIKDGILKALKGYTCEDDVTMLILKRDPR